MNNSLKISVTLMAAIVSAAMIGVSLYGFVHEVSKWGGLLVAGMACGFITMCAAYNAK